MSEEETLRVELSEKEAKQTVLEEGKRRCEKQLAELTTYTDSSSLQSDIFEMCYHMRLTLNRVIYEHKLAVLKVKEEELRKKIRELQEEKKAELLTFSPKQEHHSDLLPMQLQHHKDPQICEKTKTLPVPKPRSLPLSTSPRTSDRKITSTQTQKDRLKITQDPRTSPNFEQTRTPIPRPRKHGTRMGIIRSHSHEDEHKRGNTHPLTEQDHLPNIAPGPRTPRPMTSVPFCEKQKPTARPRRKPVTDVRKL